MSKRREKTAQEIMGQSDRSGALKRNNVYTTAAVLDWAGRIHCGPGGIKMNEKFMLEVMAMSSNPLGVCELPVRYLADHIGVGMRQAQRIIQKLIHYELVTSLDVPAQGRPNDIVRKFLLKTVLDPDTWEPPDSAQLPIMRRCRAAWDETLKAALAANEISDIGFLNLSQVHLVGVRSKLLKYVSPNAEITNTVHRHKLLLLDLVRAITKSEVDDIALIPKKGYRD